MGLRRDFCFLVFVENTRFGNRGGHGTRGGRGGSDREGDGRRGDKKKFSGDDNTDGGNIF